MSLTLAMIFFTYLQIVDAKDFIGIVLMVLSYKFGRNETKNTNQDSSNKEQIN